MQQQQIKEKKEVGKKSIVKEKGKIIEGKKDLEIKKW